MTSSEQPRVLIEPIITYPQVAEVGETYIMTIDLRCSTSGEMWSYEMEEYEISCLLDTLPLFSNESIGEPSLVLHRFGGTYGPATFLLTASAVESEGEIRITLVNQWGLPVQVLNIDNLRVVQERSPKSNRSSTTIRQGSSAEIDPLILTALVQEIRTRIQPYILDRCGRMRILDMSQPIDMSYIYTSVNVLERVSARRRLSITDLMGSQDSFNRFGLENIFTERVPGLDAIDRYSKVMLLGQPGSGKTTFLKRLAIDCIQGNFQDDKIPIFITLKDFAEGSDRLNLLEYIEQLLASLGVEDGLAQALNIEMPSELRNDSPIEVVLRTGRGLILLDGLDEIRDADSSFIVQEIREFSRTFPSNRFVITCRIAAQDYIFEDFTELEIADFDKEQIADFVHRWFLNRSNQKQADYRANRFLKSLESNPSIHELATNSLILTLLCLVFEESGNFPHNRAELLQECINVLLKKWDLQRNIERDQVYKKLSLTRKKDLLSQIALYTFESSRFFFKQQEVEQYISQYLQTLPSEGNSEILALDIEAVLRSLESQHGLLVERARGIYSFSHLIFHEYFAAYRIANNHLLENLANHIIDKSWYEVFLLTTSLLENADQLLTLMRDKIDNLVATDKKIQEFLSWLTRKAYSTAYSLKASLKQSSLRAYYFDLTFVQYQGVAEITTSEEFPFNPRLARMLDVEIDRISQRTEQALVFALILAQQPQYQEKFEDVLNRCIINSELSGSSRRMLLSYKGLAKRFSQTKPENEEASGKFDTRSRNSLVKELRNLMIRTYDIGFDWKFNRKQVESLQQYSYANQLLINCLYSDCYVSREVRARIEDNLLLPAGVISSELDQSWYSSNLNSISELRANLGCSFIGVSLGFREFIVTEQQVNEWIEINPENQEILKPLISGADIARDTWRLPYRWIIDFNGMSNEEASRYIQPFEHLRTLHQSSQSQIRSSKYKNNWWEFSRNRFNMREALSSLNIYFCTPRTSKWRVFIPCDSSWLPLDSVIVIASNDFYILGILSSNAHRIWVENFASSLDGRPRYSPKDCFDNFPFPQNPEASVVNSIRELTQNLNEYRTQKMLENKWGITHLYNSQFEDANSVLYRLHSELDRLVLEAYQSTQDSIFEHLAILNRELAEKENRGEPVVGPRFSANS